MSKPLQQDCSNYSSHMSIAGLLSFMFFSQVSYVAKLSFILIFTDATYCRPGSFLHLTYYDKANNDE